MGDKASSSEGLTQLRSCRNKALLPAIAEDSLSIGGRVGPVARTDLVLQHRQDASALSLIQRVADAHEDKHCDSNSSIYNKCRECEAALAREGTMGKAGFRHDTSSIWDSGSNWLL